MKRRLGTIHRAVGIAAILFFFVTGQIMDRVDLDHMAFDSAVRLLYRSRHIYLLFAGMMNLAVGLRYIIPLSGPGSRAAAVGSLLMLISPALMAAAFFIEPPRHGQVSVVAAVGIFASYIGLLLYCASIWKLRIKDSAVPG